MISMQTEILWDLGYIASGYALQVIDYYNVCSISTDLFILIGKLSSHVATATRLLAEVMLVIEAQAVVDETVPSGVFLVFMFFLFDAITAVAASVAYFIQIKEKSSVKLHLNIGLAAIGIAVLYTAFDIARMFFLFHQDLLTADTLQVLQNYRSASNLVLQTGTLISHSLLFYLLSNDDVVDRSPVKFYFLASATFLIFSAVLQAAIPTMSHSLTSLAWQLDLAVFAHFRFVTKPSEPKELKGTQSGGEKSPTVLLTPS